jgi:hypothetical protein
MSPWDVNQCAGMNVSTRLVGLPVLSPSSRYFDQANIECLALVRLAGCGIGGWTKLSRSVLYRHPSIINVTLGMRTRNRSDETWNSMISKSRTVSGTVSALRD